jgi:hypothetical protein
MKKILTLLFSFVIFSSCIEKMPTQKDGGYTYQSLNIDTLGIFAFDSTLGYTPFKNRKITIESQSYFQSLGIPMKEYATTDDKGRMHSTNLTNSKYNVYSEPVDTIRYNPDTGNWDSVKVIISEEIDIASDSEQEYINYTKIVFPNLVINEIFYCGSDRPSFYFYDQFVELYNASDSTKYLDGMIICRARQSVHPDLETNDFVQAIYIFQFPGTPLTGREYPIEPGEFICIAGDASDHSQYISNALNLDTVTVQWEFYNPYAGEVDNPAQNVTNILPDRTVDFLINLSHNAIILADGSDWYYGENYVSSEKKYIHIPISTVIDAVEYSSNSESNKELTRRLDAGFAGVGMSKYSGKSVERRIPGFDTNNSRLDFVILDIPTPGYYEF